jgi:hypothetical protein
MGPLKVFTSFIVHIYRFKKEDPRSLVGLVERIGLNGRRGFTGLEELWEILNSSIGDWGRDGCGPPKRKPKERRNKRKSGLGRESGRE